MEFGIEWYKISSSIWWKGCQKSNKYKSKGNFWTRAINVDRITPKFVGHSSYQLEFLTDKTNYELGNFEW